MHRWWSFNQFCDFCRLFKLDKIPYIYIFLCLCLYTASSSSKDWRKTFFVFSPPKGLFSLLDRWLGWVEEHCSCHTQHRSTGHCPLCSPVCRSEIQPDFHLWCHWENWGLWGVQQLDDCTVCVRVCLYIVTYTTNTSVFLLMQAVTVVKTEEETNQTSGASVFVNCLQISLHLFYLHAFLRIVFSGDCFLVLLYFSLGYL